MMTTQEGVDRYSSYMNRHGRIESKVAVVKGDLMEFADSTLKKLMSNFHIPNEKDFFKDPFLIKQLPRDFVVQHPAYRELCATHFYETSFGMTGADFLS
jgi:hypothetical protein